MPGYGGKMGAVDDLGLGANLANQVDDLTEEEKRKRRLGLGQSDAVRSLFGYDGPQSPAGFMSGLKYMLRGPGG